MRGRWGIAWLAWSFWLAIIICLPDMGAAAEWGWRSNPGSGMPILLVAGSSMEAQMLGEKPQSFPPSKLKILNSAPSLEGNQEGATIMLPKNLELRVSFLYNRDPAPSDPRRQDTQALLNYSMDYRIFPNLRVGLNGYLYYPKADQGFSLGRPSGDRVMGLGPGITYDLGKWSFVLKMQMEPGAGDRPGNVGNWLRVWYAF
jgi:hypothetical protein